MNKITLKLHSIGLGLATLAALTLWLGGCALQTSAQLAELLSKEAGVTRGIVALPGDTGCRVATLVAARSELTIYVQLADDKEVADARRAADEAGLLGSRVFVDKGPYTHIALADNLADILLAVGAARKMPEAEALRVLRPAGKALLGERVLVKARPAGADDWSHPYHGPDNNPQSDDQLARAPYLTQFLADPRYGPVPQISVASAGRVFKAFGHIAFKKREEPLLNTLVAFNGYNGVRLWQRDLTPGLMVHRNTMIATPDVLYLAGDKSCAKIDAATGETLGEIAPPADVAGGTFWKWMGLEDGVLYAVIGEQEPRDPTIRQEREAHGWLWENLSPGYNSPEYKWGFGRTVLALDPAGGDVLWTHREESPIDSRAVCLKNGRLYIFRFGSYLACLDARNGEVLWRKDRETAPEIFDSLGQYLPRQSWVTNWNTTAYLKCSDEALYFAGPPIGKLLAVSAIDGDILWENAYDNFQLILRDDGLYGIGGPWDQRSSRRFDALTGKVLAELDTGRRACTRPTGTVDSILFRSMGGTLRIELPSGKQRWISPMRPSCNDGVVAANGLLYWWPSVCDCQLTLYGITCLGPAGDFDFQPEIILAERLEHTGRPAPEDDAFVAFPNDWPTFRANNQGTCISGASVPEECEPLWTYTPSNSTRPTAPVAAGGLAFFAGADGVVRALDAATGEPAWTAYTGGEVRLPPTIHQGRALVGSADGWVYAFGAKSGAQQWRFRAAPAERKIPVYGTLSSTWPVAGGVPAQNGVAYAAAGIVNYDGTYVYALDVATGQVKWCNDSSGHLESEARTGVSVQGHMLIDDGKLYLAGGNAVSPAIYDLDDGACLNGAENLRGVSAAPRGWELFKVGDHIVAAGKPYYTRPDHQVYDATVVNKMLVASTGETDLVWINNHLIAGLPPQSRDSLNACVTKRIQPAFMLPPWGFLDLAQADPRWQKTLPDSRAIAVCRNAVVVAGPDYVRALNLTDGAELWQHPLPVAPVPWGLAIDRHGRVIVLLEDGRALCFGQAKQNRIKEGSV